jgi:acetyltransferase-like isoleucine patch superfamily enzyme
VFGLNNFKKFFFPRSYGEKFKSLKSSGNLFVGLRSDITNLKITSFADAPNSIRIDIGNDCLLLCSIVLYSNNAKVSIGDRVFIGENTTLFCFEEITIENDVMISSGCTLIDTNSHSLNSEERKNDVLDWKKGFQFKNWDVVKREKILIKEKSWVGFNSIISKGVVLGKGTIVASGSVVSRSSDEYTVIGGNPARFIKTTQ